MNNYKPKMVYVRTANIDKSLINRIQNIDDHPINNKDTKLPYLFPPSLRDRIEKC